MRSPRHLLLTLLTLAATPTPAATPPIVREAAWEVAIDWPAVGCGPQPLRPGPFPAVESLLHRFGEDALLVDLRFPGTSEPLLEPGGLYGVGEAPMVPARAFDGLVYLDRSRKMTPLAWASCQ